MIFITSLSLSFIKRKGKLSKWPFLSIQITKRNAAGLASQHDNASLLHDYAPMAWNGMASCHAIHQPPLESHFLFLLVFYPFLTKWKWMFINPIILWRLSSVMVLSSLFKGPLKALVDSTNVFYFGEVWLVILLYN